MLLERWFILLENNIAKSIGPKKADLGWLFYLSGEGEERQSADDLLDVLLHQRIQKDYREKIFLDPPPAVDCIGDYALGKVDYPPGKQYCQFGLREQEWIKHVLITGMTGTGKTNLAFHMLRELKKGIKFLPTVKTRVSFNSGSWSKSL